MNDRPLFGGSIVAEIPSNFIDASDLRQVPDTQEVFLDPESDVSIIVEILQRVDISDPDGAIQFHFSALEQDNDAVSSSVHAITTLTQTQEKTPAPIVLDGHQRVRKFNQTEPDNVRIVMALYRVPEKNVDIVVTANAPAEAGDQGWSTAKERFERLVTSLRIVDYNLFA